MTKDAVKSENRPMRSSITIVIVLTFLAIKFITNFFIGKGNFYSFSTLINYIL